MKKCSKCLENKNLNEFSKDSKKKDGLKVICKLCHSIYRKEHYQKNKDKVIEQVKLWQINNSDKVSEQSKKWKEKKTFELFEKYGDVIYLEGFNIKANRVFKTNCSMCNKSIARHRNDIIDKVDFFCKDCKKKNPIITFIKQQIKNSKKRSLVKKIEFDLDFDFLIKKYEEINFKCESTNIDFIFTEEKNIRQPSIDRIDSSKGYTKDNIKIVCLGYNYMKNTFDYNSVNDFLILLKMN